MFRTRGAGSLADIDLGFVPPPAHRLRDLNDYDRAFGVNFNTAAVTSDGKVA